MRIGLVIDAACDLPASIIRDYRIEVMPVAVQIGDLKIIDNNDPEATAAFYRNFPVKSGSGDSLPTSVDEIRAAFLDHLVLEYDFVFFLTTASSRSKIYDNALHASLGIISEYKTRRMAAGLSGSFVMRVIDSQVLFGAQAISAIEAARMIRADATPAQIETRLNELIPHVYGYIVPNDLVHVFQAAKRRGEPPTGPLRFLFARLLDVKPVLRIVRNTLGAVAGLRKFEHANTRLFRFGVERIKAGLLTPVFGVGYAGDFSRIEKIPGFAELREAAAAASVELVTFQMGIVAGTYLGKDVIGITFAAPDHKFR